MASVLDKIVATKRAEIAAAKAATPEAALRELSSQRAAAARFLCAAGGRPGRFA